MEYNHENSDCEEIQGNVRENFYIGRIKKLDAKLEKIMEALKPLPNYPLPEDIVSGAIFDFCGFLTTRLDCTVIGSNSSITNIFELISIWANGRNISIQKPDVEGWFNRLEKLGNTNYITDGISPIISEFKIGSSIHSAYLSGKREAWKEAEEVIKNKVNEFIEVSSLHHLEEEKLRAQLISAEDSRKAANEAVRILSDNHAAEMTKFKEEIGLLLLAVKRVLTEEKGEQSDAYRGIPL